MKRQLIISGETKNVLRIPVSQIIIYELTRDELNILKAGNSDINLNFSISLGSVTISLLSILLIETIENDITKISFIILTVIFFILTIYFFLMHRKEKGAFHDVVAKIEKRYNEIHSQE